MDTKQNPPQWAELLKKAVEEPGKLLEAYSVFHTYSLANCLAAAFQLDKRGIPLGPINTFRGWLKLGRHVQKGEKALVLCMPLTAKGKSKTTSAGESEDEYLIRGFYWKPYWFALAQTEGTDFQAEPNTGIWDKALALATLDISEVSFAHLDGNCQGFAKAHSIAVSPIAQLPHKSLFHEIAHVVLGHTMLGECSDGAALDAALKEVEAESVALLLCETLQLPGAAYCRGYVQNWWKGEPIPDSSAQRIFSVANKILKAGQAEAE